MLTVCIKCGSECRFPLEKNFKRTFSTRSAMIKESRQHLSLVIFWTPTKFVFSRENRHYYRLGNESAIRYSQKKSNYLCFCTAYMVSKTHVENVWKIREDNVHNFHYLYILLKVVYTFLLGRSVQLQNVVSDTKEIMEEYTKKTSNIIIFNTFIATQNVVFCGCRVLRPFLIVWGLLSCI